MRFANSVEISHESIESPELELGFVFRSYGVTVRIDSNSESLLAKARSIAKKSFIERLEFIENKEFAVDYSFGLVRGDNGSVQLLENGAFRSEPVNEIVCLNFFRSYLRAIVAERATPWVFVHAGVVSYKGQAVIIPGSSYSGKTTLVAEFLKQGAQYFSDEYAVFDESGVVHPFPRDLSVRVDGDRRVVRETRPEELGAEISTTPTRVGFVLITHFDQFAVWAPERLTLGNGIKEVIAHTISIKYNTPFGLKVLNAAFENAIIFKGARAEAARLAESVLSMLDDNTNWS